MLNKYNKIIGTNKSQAKNWIWNTRTQHTKEKEQKQRKKSQHTFQRRRREKWKEEVHGIDGIIPFFCIEKSLPS